MSMKDLLNCLDKQASSMDDIRRHLGEPEILAQLMEECAELGQAASKLRRGLDGRNVTPVSIVEAEEKMQEEMADVLVLMMMAGMDFAEMASVIYKKVPRWKERLGLK